MGAVYWKPWGRSFVTAAASISISENDSVFQELVQAVVFFTLRTDLGDRCAAGQRVFFFGVFLGFGVQRMQLMRLWSWH